MGSIYFGCTGNDKRRLSVETDFVAIINKSCELKIDDRIFRNRCIIFDKIYINT
jgi:hypothetical protein